MEKELYQRAEDYGNGLEGRALRESAERIVRAGEIKGYLAYDNGIAIGWCNWSSSLLSLLFFNY